jgi:hypothetical protein
MFRRLFGRRGSEPVSSAQPDPGAGGTAHSPGGEGADAGPVHPRPTGPAMPRWLEDSDAAFPQDVARYRRSIVDTFEEKYAFARSIAGFSVESLQNFDACINILRTGGWRRPLESVIDAMSGEVRRDLYH